MERSTGVAGRVADQLADHLSGRSPLRAAGVGSAGGLSVGLRRAVARALPDGALRRVQAWRGRPPPRRVQLEDLDAELAEAAGLFEASEDAARAFLRGFELDPPPGRPADPFSDEYRSWVWRLYHSVARRPRYSTANEASSFDVDAALIAPYPYSTRSTTIVGEELIARGFLIKTLGLRPPARIVEFGSGWGNLTVDLAAMGFEVTAVEVEDRFCSLVARRTPRSQLLTVVRSDMLSFTPERPVDAAIFYESFHHCADHVRMLQRLTEIVRPEGVVLWAGEPVAPMACPWGLRLDGYSLWSTRAFGWLELGFDPSYFAEALARTGWRAARWRLPAGSPLADVIIAARRPATGRRAHPGRRQAGAKGKPSVAASDPRGPIT